MLSYTYNPIFIRGATAGKAPKAWVLPRFWVSIHSYKKQPVKKLWGRIMGLAWLKFVAAPLYTTLNLHRIKYQNSIRLEESSGSSIWQVFWGVIQWVIITLFPIGNFLGTLLHTFNLKYKKNFYWSKIAFPCNWIATKKALLTD